MTGDEATETKALQAFGTIDAVFDISPSGAKDSTHLRSALNVLRPKGRCSLMGSIPRAIVHHRVMSASLTLKGKMMYEREAIVHLIKMLERGLYAHGKNLVDARAFSLDDWAEAFDTSAEHTGAGKVIVIRP
jgi:threonine dehydrogenase-like Zn-dependent dehydrogenase